MICCGECDDTMRKLEAERDALKAEVARLKNAAGDLAAEINRLCGSNKNLWETLRSIAGMNPTTDAEKMRQWAADSISGYTKSRDETMFDLSTRLQLALDEIEHLKTEQHREAQRRALLGESEEGE